MNEESRVRSSRWRFGIFLLLLCLFLPPPRPQAQAEDSAVTWQPWEHGFTSRKSYPEPYKDLTLTATFTGPGGRTFSVPGFWASGDAFKIRCAFPAPGVWQWKTTCSDAADQSLHNQSGRVSVAAYAGENPLFRNGFLRVAASKRHLAHADGTPFLWLGDTGWMALRQSTAAEWKAYVDDRAAKGFSIIQVHASQSSVRDSSLRDFTPVRAGLPDPEYFRELEEKIGYANQRGIVILLVGLGVSGKGHYIPDMNTAPFARYLTGRLAGHAVVLSPSMDAPYDERNDRMATLLKAASSVHLVTQHVGTKAGAAAAYQVKPSIDFTALQSGHHNGNTAQAYAAAVQWTQELWQLEPTKPIVNSEAMYDGRGNDRGNDWREQDARKLGWMGWLSWAPGYTYGAGETDRHVTGGSGGLWRFVKDSTAFDYWRKALAWPSSRQVGYMKQFFAQIPWWELEPAPALILNQAKSPQQTMTLARSRDGSWLVAYLPENHDVKISLEGMPEGMRGQWFDPVTNQYFPIAERIEIRGEQTFPCPGPGDWVLLLNKK